MKINKDLTKEVIGAEWITLKKLADETGQSVKYLQGLCRKGILPHAKPNGKLINVSRTEYNEWMNDNRIKSAKEIEMEAATIVTLGKVKR